ncbi:MAG: HAMP domain-containing histidine kinase [Algicola sp.]|nr:HAMP domain-containing histidine kinase [Algicola sp.]
MSIRNRIIIYFGLLALIVSAIFSVFNLVFMWSVEDLALQQILKTEKAHVLKGYFTHQQFNLPRHGSVSLYLSIDDFPPSIKDSFLQDPNQSEIFSDNGENYHILPILKEPEAYLVGEFSEQLIVRPIADTVLMFLGFVTVLLVLVSCAIGWMLANKAVKPLSSLLQLLQSTTPEKLPQNFAKQYSEDEVGYLAQTLESTLVRIRDFIQREQHFTRDVSHELRTPIAVIKGAGELIAQQLDSEKYPVVARLNSAVLQMEQIIETLLNLAREEKDWSYKETFKLLPKIEDCVIQYATLIGQKPVELDITLGPADAVHANPVAVEILLANIISNAFKHIQQGTVVIAYSDNLLSITDTGQGISEELKGRIFQSGVKGEKSSGFGVGLSLVKRLCQRQGIRIAVHSSEKGTRVELGF